MVEVLGRIAKIDLNPANVSGELDGVTVEVIGDTSGGICTNICGLVGRKDGWMGAIDTARPNRFGVVFGIEPR